MAASSGVSMDLLNAAQSSASVVGLGFGGGGGAGARATCSRWVMGAPTRTVPAPPS
jgi:hypothetical protein